MDDLIKSLENKLLTFDKESVARDLLIKDRIENGNYWDNLKKFKEEFEKLIWGDVKELINALKSPFLQRNILIKSESHRKIGRKYFYAKLPIYVLISICDRSYRLDERWKKSPFLLIKGDYEKKTISIYDCNQDLINTSSFFETNLLENPLEQFLIFEYNFTLLKPHIEMWINSNLDRILKTENYKSNNNII